MPADGVTLVHVTISMWQFHAVTAKEMVNYVDMCNDDNGEISVKMELMKSSHHPTKLSTLEEYYCCMCKLEVN